MRKRGAGGAGGDVSEIGTSLCGRMRSAELGWGGGAEEWERRSVNGPGLELRFL